jgi:hypothetical protein
MAYSFLAVSRAIGFLAAALITAGGSYPATAQEVNPAPQDHPLVDSALDRRRLVEANLPLTEAEARLFWPVYQHYQQELYKLMAKRKSLIGDLGENYDDMPDSVAQDIIYGYTELQQNRLGLLRSYLPKFAAVLPPKKLVRYYQIETKIRAAVDAEIAERIPLIE